jgi:hypothetical protein
MIRLKAHVRDGGLLVDEPTNLPDGTEVELISADCLDDLDEDERTRLNAALAASEEDVRNGSLHSAPEVIANLRRRSS